MVMDRIVPQTFVVQCTVVFAMLAAAAQSPEAVSMELSKPLASPTPAAYDIRTRQLITATASGDVRHIAATLTRSPRDAARLRTSAGSNSILRLRVDSQRGRLWVLGVGRVHVFDLATNRLVRSIALPDWLDTDDGANCLPDLQLDSSGAAFVSDNVQQKLWRIDSHDFSLRVRSVALDSQRGVDAGFSALAMGEGGVLFAAMAAPGSLWRIDTATFRAENVPLSAPIHGACALEMLNATDSRGITLFVLSAGRASFDVGRIDIVPGCRVAQVERAALGSVPEPASLLASGGTLYIAANDMLTPVFRRQRASRAVPVVSFLNRMD
jgi:hypothetical protein